MFHPRPKSGTCLLLYTLAENPDRCPQTHRGWGLCLPACLPTTSSPVCAYTLPRTKGIQQLQAHMPKGPGSRFPPPTPISIIDEAGKRNLGKGGGTKAAEEICFLPLAKVRKGELFLGQPSTGGPWNSQDSSAQQRLLLSSWGCPPLQLTSLPFSLSLLETSSCS